MAVPAKTTLNVKATLVGIACHHVLRGSRGGKGERGEGEGDDARWRGKGMMLDGGGRG